MDKDFSYATILDKNIQIMAIMTEHAQQLNDMLDNVKCQDQLDYMDQILRLSKAIRLLSESTQMMANEIHNLNIEMEKMKLNNN